MKFFLLAICTLFALPAMAERFDLSPGSIVKVGNNEFYCAGGGNARAVCSIKKTDYGYFAVYSDANQISAHGELNAALVVLKSLRDAGACQ